MGFFKDNDLTKLEAEIELLTLQLADEKKRNDELLERNKELRIEVEELERTNEYNKRLNELKFKEDYAQLLSDKSSLTSKVEVLEQAFENLGFDVKDMKDILNKLVDGVVSKNTINVVK